MLASALRLYMAHYSTSMAYGLVLPIVALPIMALPIVALPFVALAVVALRVSSSTFLPCKQCAIWITTAGSVEAGFFGQEVGDDIRHCVCLLSELECGCKGSPFFGIWEIGHDLEFPPRVFDRDVAYSKH
jgi:hypothetical protein